MIQSLELCNFESYRHSKLEFVPGVNIVVGATDAGKTAIMRAFRWCINNRPNGSDFVSWEGVNDEGDTQVIITTDTDTITRSKGKIELYKVNKLELKAFNKDVPSEVSQALNLSEINIKSQFESHFLLSKTSGEVASFFNKIARLDIIDTATNNVNRWINEIKQDIASKNRLIEENQIKLKTFDYLTEFETEVETLEDAEIDLREMQSQYDQLNKLLTDIDRVNAAIEQEQLMVQSETLINSILDDYNQRRALQTKHDNLTVLLNEIDDIQRQSDEFQQLLGCETLINELLKLYKERAIAETEHIKLSRLLHNISGTETQLKQAETRYNALHKQFEDEFPSVCPLCGKPK
jgi:AAA15 family ATPase/GTPase